MHNIYINKGSFDIEYKLPKIIYSSLISMVLNKILKILSLTNDSIIDFKQVKIQKHIIKKGNELKNKLKIKFVLFFILSFAFLLFFLYYIFLFDAIYINTQYHLLKDRRFRWKHLHLMLFHLLSVQWMFLRKVGFVRPQRSIFQ